MHKVLVSSSLSLLWPSELLLWKVVISITFFYHHIIISGWGMCFLLRTNRRHCGAQCKMFLWGSPTSSGPLLTRMRGSDEALGSSITNNCFQGVWAISSQLGPGRVGGGGGRASSPHNASAWKTPYQSKVLAAVAGAPLAVIGRGPSRQGIQFAPVALRLARFLSSNQFKLVPVSCYFLKND